MFYYYYYCYYILRPRRCSLGRSCSLGSAACSAFPAAGGRSKRQRSIGKGGFIGASAEGLTVLSMCPKTGRAQAQKVCAGVAMALESRLCACLFWRSVGGALGRRSRHSGGATCLTLLV